MYKKGHKQGIILETNVSSISMERVLRIVRRKISEAKKFYIVTPNPEIVLKAVNDEKLKIAINNADIAIADGIGLAMAQKFLKLPNPKNIFRRILVLIVQGLGVGFSSVFDRKWLLNDFTVIRGRDLFIELVKLANKKRWKVFLLGDRKGSAKLAEDVLRKNYKKVKFFSKEGPRLNNQAKPSSKNEELVEKRAINAINKVSPELLFIAFGAPRQEKWIYKHINKLNIGGAMVVGGTFDYISGETKLPPLWLSEAGLEWLWRLINEPKRAKRIIKATVVFSFKIFSEKLAKLY